MPRHIWTYMLGLCIYVGGVVCQLSVQPNGTIFHRSLGDNIVFTCSLDLPAGSVIVNIQWLNQQRVEILDKSPGRDNTPYIEQPRPDEPTKQLKIVNIEAKHRGTYYCQAVVGGNVQQITVILELFAVITFDDARTPQTPVAYTNAQIICRVSGNPNPTVYWRYRGQRLVTGTRYSQVNYGLLIRNITDADNGIYTCAAEVQSTGALAQREIEVIVYHAPVITQGPGNIDAIQSQEYVLRCKARGVPDPKYEFFKDGNEAPVFSNGNHEFEDRVQVDGDLGVIHFRPLIKEDEGSYRCHAFSEAGEDSVTGHLRVLIPPTVYNIKNVTQSEGGTTTLVCLSWGDPPPAMIYHKEGHTEDYLMGSNEDGRINLTNPVAGRLDMTISHLVPDDTANYTCKSRNVAGRHELNGSVTVNFRPRFLPGQTTLVYNWAGKTRNLTCKVKAEPLPNIEWLRYGRVLRDNETFRTYVMSKDSNLQVTVREVDEEFIYGNYSCRATNHMGVGIHLVEMRRAKLPGPPQSASIIEISPTTVLLDIQHPLENGGVEIYGFRVQYLLKIDDFMIGDPYFVEYLQPHTDYQFIIRAMSEVGDGMPLSYVVTTPDVSVPYSLILTSDHQGAWPYEYTVSWEKPKTGGLPIREYEFKFRRVKVKPGTYEFESTIEDWMRRVREEHDSDGILYYLLQQLYPSSYYQLEVKAMNDVGWSEANPEFIFSTASDSQYLYLFPGSAEHIHDFTVLPTIAASLFAILYSVLWMP